MIVDTDYAKLLVVHQPAKPRNREEPLRDDRVA